MINNRFNVVYYLLYLVLIDMKKYRGQIRNEKGEVIFSRKGNFENKLSDEGITLPDAPAPAANYVPYVQVGNVLYVSGQISQNESGLILGKLGENMTTEQGAEAAKFCAMSLLAQVKSACDGDLDRLVRVIKLTGFVNSTPDFTQQPQVINGASDLLGNVLGDAGKHARVAVSANSLPLGVAVEIDGIFQIA